MKKMNFKSIFIPVLSLFIICAVIAAALAFTNDITQDKIAQNNEQKKTASMTVVCPDAKSFDEIVPESLYAGKDDSGNIVGYAVSTVSSAGYGGQIKVMTGIDTNGEIVAIDIFYNSDETPGLGQNTSNESFTKSFKGLTTSQDIFVDKDFSGEGQSVDSVTAATISSRAVVDAVNQACQLYEENIVGGEQ